MAAIFSLTGYLGINFVLALIGSFGVLTAVTGMQVHMQAIDSVKIVMIDSYIVTTLRKALTMVLSFVIFTKPFTQQ